MHLSKILQSSDVRHSQAMFSHLYNHTRVYSVVIGEMLSIDRPTYEVFHLTLISQKNHLAGHPRQKQVDGESLKESYPVVGHFLFFIIIDAGGIMPSKKSERAQFLP